MKVVLHLSTAGLAQKVSLTLRLRWPDLQLCCADSEDHLVKLAPSSEVVFLDELSTRRAGLQLVQRIRESTDAAVFVLARRPSEEEMVNALEAGADDYLGSSSSPAQLVTRTGAVVRRLRAVNGTVARFGPLGIDQHTHQAHIVEEELHLSPTEFLLLRELATAKGGLVTNECLHKIIGKFPEELWRDSLRKHVQRLRGKVKAAGEGSVDIYNVRGVGYRLTYSE